jgi:flagellar FliL protein
MTLTRFILALLLGFTLIANHSFAEEDAAEEESVEEGGEAPPPPAIYIPLKPQFVVNYGGPGKNRFLKAGVTLRLGNSSAANSVRHHMPYIRNQLVFIFAAQTDESLESQDGREAMRQTALGEIRQLLEMEDGLAPDDIVDVLFNSLTWH